MNSDQWALHVGAFVDRHYGSIRGRVRTHVIDQHLRMHLDPPPEPIVDVGGGAGNQALPLARRGYPVTIIDPSQAMLDRARQALADEPVEVARRVVLLCGDGRQALDLVGSQRFAGVLCHGVIPYVDERAALVATLCALVRPGGVVSIVSKNAATLAMRPATEGRWNDTLAAFDARTEINALGLYTRADTVEELSAELSEHGVDPVAWYGVRLFVDVRDREFVPSPDEERAILAAELEASRRDPYRQLSRLFHLVGRKSAP